MTYSTIGVIGGGAWGTALAIACARAGREVLVWAHSRETVEEINDKHTNVTFLPGVPLNRGIRATSSLAEAAGRELILMVVPAQHVRQVARDMAVHVAGGRPIVICAKGLEQASSKLMSEVLGEALPAALPAVLSGPSFAAEVARGLPAAVTLACTDEALGRRIALTIGHKSFRPYWSSDMVGVQLGGAVKNVLAIAAGIVDGKGLGASAHAALVTRGFAELVRFGQALGARPETLMGLSGLGDLQLTCSSPQSRNMSLGRALGQGESLADILAARRSVTEGVYTASAVTRIAAARGIEMPISEAVHAIVSGAITVDAAIDALLSRPFKAES